MYCCDNQIAGLTSWIHEKGTFKSSGIYILLECVLSFFMTWQNIKESVSKTCDTPFCLFRLLQ